MKPRTYVFYAGLLHSEWYYFPTLADLGAEVYNGAWVWVSEQWKPAPIFEAVGWYRADRVPCLIEDVPKELRTMVLLMP